VISARFRRRKEPSEARVTLAAPARRTNHWRVAAVLDRTISVRRRTADDDPFIERLSAQAFGDFHRNAGSNTLGLTRHPESVTRVAVRAAERLGFVVLEFGRDSAWIQAIAVERSERGRGVGARLMAEAVRLARETGAPRLRLTTAQANVEALELFLKCGFAIERRLARYYARGQDACILARAL
jgi:ribosomal protein S18 acetylase RimI-like enzyme